MQSTMTFSSRQAVPLAQAKARGVLPRPALCRLPSVRCTATLSAAVVLPSTNGNGLQAVAPAIKFPEPLPGVLAPAANYENVAKAGAAKAAMAGWKILLMGVMAGAYIGLGGFMAASTAGSLGGLTTSSPGLAKLVAGLVFPFGLMINVLCGGELFTGNTAFVLAAVLEKKATWGQLAKNWALSYVGNLIGSLLMVSAALATGLLATNAAPLTAAVVKTSLPWMQAFVRGILANLLVCTAVWMAASANSLPGKTIALWIPVAAFVAMGFEHSVANMFTVSLGIALGAKVTWMEFLVNNLVPVTLGNIIGGALCMAITYSLCYGSLGKPATASN